MPCGVEQCTPRPQARRQVVLINVLHLGNELEEMRVPLMPQPEGLEQLQRAVRGVLVPEVDDLKLIIGLAPHQRAFVARPDHLLQAFDAVASRQEQQPPEYLRGRGRHVRVVVVEADPEPRVVQVGVEDERLFQRVLDSLAVACGGQALAPQHAPLHPRAVGAPEIEPGFGALRLTGGPGLRARHGVVDALLEFLIEREVERVQLNLPPERHGIEHATHLTRRRRTRLFELRRNVFELGVEDGVVYPRELRRFGEPAQRLRSGQLGQRHGECARQRDQPHVTLVRSCCFSAWRSSASETSRSIRSR
jgi:hypothetical protein